MTYLLPVLSVPTLDEVQSRLETIFPPSFPDRSILVGDMATRLVFVGLYGCFVEGTGNWFRPSTVIRFSLEQAALTSTEARMKWFSACQAPGFVPLGKQWYADNSREPLRDDLIRNRAIPVGIVVKREGVPTTSPAPIYALSKPFADLFDPLLSPVDLHDAIERWQKKHLDPLTLKRMQLLATGVLEKEGQVTVVLPAPKVTLRLAAGEASHITKAVCETMSRIFCSKPVFVHVSTSEKKQFPELAAAAAALDIKLDSAAELPDVVFVNSADMTLVFVEVVHSDGPITELRKESLLRIAKQAGFPPEKVQLVTAFDDRSVQGFRKRVSEIARDSWVWFRTEPHLFMKLETRPEPVAA
jgi:hypothetical protein